MLLPSALSCESRQQQHPGRPRLAGGAGLFPSTPPPSDDGFIAGNGLLGTCRALQSLLNGSPATSSPRSRAAKLKHSEQQHSRRGLQSPLEFRAHPLTRSHKVVKPATRPQAPPRGLNKRRRDVYEEDYFDNDAVDGESSDGGEETLFPARDTDIFYKTPKRRRRAPLDVPFGLETSTFRSLQMTTTTRNIPAKSPEEDLEATPKAIHSRQNANREDACNTSCAIVNIDSSSSIEPPDITERSLLADTTNLPPDWTSEDDRRLVELVLDKLRLSKRDWNDCARKMGKDHDSVGKRWKALVGEGNVGLRRGRRIVRGRIDESWRK